LLIMVASASGAVSAARCRMRLRLLLFGMPETTPKSAIETSSMTPWLVHELRRRTLSVVCLDARHARAALKMQINKTDRNDAEGLAQIMRTGWYRPVHVKSFEAHRARALLAARLQLIETTTRLSNHIRGVLKTFGLLPGTVRGLRFDARVELLLEGRAELALIVTIRCKCCTNRSGAVAAISLGRRHKLRLLQRIG